MPPSFAELPDLASCELGTKVLFATDDFFAVAENLFLTEEPVFVADKYTEFGKWMDGWETRRRRIPGHDWCIVRLGLAGFVHGFLVDTAFFTGNHTPRISIQGASLNSDPNLLPRPEKDLMGTAASSEAMKLAEAIGSEKWDELLPFTPLAPGYPDSRKQYFVAAASAREKSYTHLRINYYPDGGIARIRVHGIASPNWNLIESEEVIDFASMVNGGHATGCSDSHFGRPSNLVLPGRGKNMSSGWETARNPQRPAIFEMDPSSGRLIAPGQHWARIVLGHSALLQRVLIDTAHFKGNFPESFELLGEPADLGLKVGEEADERELVSILPRTPLGPDQIKELIIPNANLLPAIQAVRLIMYPDGGISRLRLFGTRS